MDAVAADDRVIDTRLRSLPVERARERQFAEESHHYIIILRSDPTGEMMKLRVPAVRHDEDRNVVLKDGQYERFDPHEVARKVWAVVGADEYDVEMVLLGSTPVATADTLAIHLAVNQNLRGKIEEV